MQIRAKAIPISPSHWVMQIQEEEHPEDEVIDLGAPLPNEELDFTFELRMSSKLAERITQCHNEWIATRMKKSGQTLIPRMNAGQALMVIIQSALITGE